MTYRRAYFELPILAYGQIQGFSLLSVCMKKSWCPNRDKDTFHSLNFEREAVCQSVFAKLWPASVVVCGAAAVVVVVGGQPGNVGRVMPDKWFALCWQQRGMLTAHNLEWLDTLVRYTGLIHLRGMLGSLDTGNTDCAVERYWRYSSSHQVICVIS